MSPLSILAEHWNRKNPTLYYYSIWCHRIKKVLHWNKFIKFNCQYLTFKIIQFLTMLFAPKGAKKLNCPPTLYKIINLWADNFCYVTVTWKKEKNSNFTITPIKITSNSTMFKTGTIVLTNYNQIYNYDELRNVGIGGKQTWMNNIRSDQ